MLLLILLLSLVLGGHIQTWDVELDYTNSGYATKFTLPFKLDNSLPTFGFLRVVFPFSLHYTATNSQPDNVKVYYKQALGNYACGIASQLPAKVFVNDEPNTYYVQFLDTKSQSVELLNDTFYYVTLQTGGKNLNIQRSGVQNPIRLYSVTSFSKLAMILDYNPSAHAFFLSTEPFQQMTVRTSLIGSSFQKMSDLYQANITVQFMKEMVEGCKVQLIFDESDGFLFEEGCSIQNPGLQYTCQHLQSMSVFSISNQVRINDQISFLVNVRNPNRITLPTTLQVRSLLQFANQIIELAETTPIFEVKQLILQTHTLRLGWGMEYSARSAYFYPFPIIIFRGDSNGRTTPYNAFKWQFSIGEDLPEDILLQVEVATPMKFNSFLMTGSISHNFPDYSGSKVKCIFKKLKF